MILHSDQLSTAQDIAKAIRHLAIVLPLLSLALFALAVWLARGRRRRALRTTGWCVVAIGVLLLLIRRIAGNQVVNGLVKVRSNRPAVHEVWSIATQLLYAIAVAMVVYGIIVVLCAWLAGPTRPATFLRRLLAPPLRDHSAAVYSFAGGVLLLVVLWGPTPAFRKLVPVLLIAGLMALGVTALRRQTALEFPDARQGDALEGLRAAWQARRTGAASPAPARGGAVDELERLAALHDSGALTDAEFSAQKEHVLGRA